MITIISTKTRNQRLIQISLNIIVLLVSVSIPAMTFKIVLEQTKWWTTLNGIHVLNAPIEKRILGLMAWSVILLFAWIIIQSIIADIYDNFISYHKKTSLNQPKISNLSKIKQVISAFKSCIIVHSLLFSILYTILGTILSPHQITYLILTVILFGIDWLVNTVKLP